MYWHRKREDALPRSFYEETGNRSLDRQVLSIERGRFEREIEGFWKFRSKRVLTLLFINQKRKERFMLAFAFQKYKLYTVEQKLH